MRPATPPVMARPVLQVGDHLWLRLLALVVDAEGRESYRVCFRTGATEPLVDGTLSHVRDDVWVIEAAEAGCVSSLSWDSPDAVFALARGVDPVGDVAAVHAAVPYWPDPIRDRLVRRGLSGPGTVAFDAGWFLAALASSAFDHPIVLCDGASKLGLVGLERAAAILRAAVDEEDGDATGLAPMLLRAVGAEPPLDCDLAWHGEGRLIGAFDGGELAQLGDDIGAGCRAALGTGSLEVVFSSREPLGLGLGPAVASALSKGELSGHSVGMGCVVGEVEPGGAAERAGVRPGMVLSHLSGPGLALPVGGPEALTFEAVLEALDARRGRGGSLTVAFDTAAAASHLYAVEMPAAVTLRALSATVAGAPRVRSRDVGVGVALNALCGSALVWREETPRLFLGEAGSVTCAHIDMCPQVQMAHGLLGTKLLGVASHPATPRLRAEHGSGGEGEDPDRGATSLPTDRPLTPVEARLLGDPEMTVARLGVGDLAVFDSGALHVASNGAEGLGGALYHGMVTPGAVPRLRLAAQARAALPRDGVYEGHLYAPELLRIVERRLAAFAGAERRKRSASLDDETAPIR